MKRGDLVTVAGAGDHAGKPRPAVVVQAFGFEALESLTVCPTTSNEAGDADIRFAVEPSSLNNLLQRSWIMVDKIETVRRRKVGQRIGELSLDELRVLDRRLSLFLGLGTAAP